LRLFGAACVTFLTLAPSGRADEPLGPHADELPPKMVGQAQLDELQRLIDATPDTSDDKPALLYRQATLYRQLARFYGARAASAPDGPRRDEDQRKHEAWLLGAAKLHLALTDQRQRFASFAQMDEVLLSLATLLVEAHREEAARMYFKMLIVEHPRSPLVPEAFLVFGDYFFDQHDYGSAHKFYDRVLQFPQSRVADYARYKMAWAALYERDCGAARTDFRRVADGKSSAIAADARRQLERIDGGDVMCKP
jgi:hypothetical protein